MISFLHGTLEEKQPTHAILNVGGVGYEVIIPLSSYDRLPKAGESCRILVYDHVREDSHQLFGFMTEAERKLFVMLMTVTGIGPKIALSALSGMSVREIKAAIAQRDAKRLSSISGVGKKTAERMIVDLRDKLEPAEALEAVSGAGGPVESDAKLRDAVMALISLGYKRTEAQDMASRVMARADSGDLSVEAIVRHALAG